MVLGLMPSVGGAVSTTHGAIVDERTSTSDPGTVTFHATTFALGLIKRETANAAGARNWYVDLDSSGTVSIGDLRMNTHEGATTFQAGTKVGSSDVDRNSVLEGAAGILCYVETYMVAGKNFRGTNRFNPPTTSASAFLPEGEALYLQPSGACATQASGSDHVRVTKTPSTNPVSGGLAAGTRIKAGEADVGDNTTRLVTTDHTVVLRFVDKDLSGALSNSDPIYLQIHDGAAPNQPSPGDVRLFAGSTYQFGSEAYGSHVEIDSFDVEKVLNAIGAALIQFVNFDGAGALPSCTSSTLNDSIYLNIDGAGTVADGDIRLAVRSSGTGTAGSTVRTGEADVTDALTGFAAATFLKYADLNNDGVFNFGDQIVLDVGGGTADLKVTAGDIRLSTVVSGAGSVGTCVASGATDENQPLTALAINVGFLDAHNAGAYQPGNPVYFGDTRVTIGDVRWSGLFSSFGSYGTQVDDDDVDRTWSLTAFAAPALCFLPTNTPTYASQDPAYFVTNNGACGAALAVGDLRLSGTGTLAAGTQVRVGDHDFSDPVSALGAGKLMYVESGTSSSGYDDDDDVYVSTDGTAQVQVGHIRVTGGTGGTSGTKVASGATDLSSTLRDFPSAAFAVARMKFFKVVPPSGTSFSTTYVPGDVVVYDQNNDGFLDIGDVFMSGTGGATTLAGTGVTPPPPPPTQNTPQPTSSFSLAIDGFTITVNGASSVAPTGRTITTYAWTFGDGNSAAGAQRTYTYETDGFYRVTLTVTDSAGQAHTSARDITIGTPTAPPSGPDPTPGLPDPTPTPDDGNETDGDGAGNGDDPEGTPGPAMALVVMALVGLLAVTRRRT